MAEDGPWGVGDQPPEPEGPDSDDAEMAEDGPWDMDMDQPPEPEGPGSSEPEEEAAEDWISMGEGSENRFQGDIVLTEEQERQLNGTERNAITNTAKLWSGATVPYVISSSFSSTERNVIMGAFAAYHQKTCIKFVARTTQSKYINIIKSSGCWSYVGTTGGAQSVSIGNGCAYHYIVFHELMHAVGFYHEQSRYDRDTYVTVNYANIRSGRSHNFNKYTSSQVQTLGEPYDYASVMHYSKYAFSSNGQPTIQAKDNPSRTLGNRVGPTQIDINKLNKLYQCSGTTGTSGTTPSTTTTTAAPSTSCKDVYTGTNQCSYWANTMNYCTSSRYGTWMGYYCRSTCSKCSPCSDRYSACTTYKSRGYCTMPNTFAFMAAYCPVSCGYCQSSTTSSSCVDRYPQSNRCPAYAARGYCTNSRYQTFMRYSCKKSCDSYLQSCSDCSDYNSSVCTRYVSYCNSTTNASMKTFMQWYCRKSCNFC